MNQQLDSFKRKLRDAGCAVSTGFSVSVPGSEDSLLFLTVRHPDATNHDINMIVRDMGDDGYFLYTETTALAIDTDIETVLTMLVIEAKAVRS